MVDEGALKDEVDRGPRNLLNRRTSEDLGTARRSSTSSGSTMSSANSTNALARELTDIIRLLSARGSRAPVPSWLVGRLVTYRDHLAHVSPPDDEPS